MSNNNKSSYFQAFTTGFALALSVFSFYLVLQTRENLNDLYSSLGSTYSDSYGPGRLYYPFESVSPNVTSEIIEIPEGGNVWTEVCRYVVKQQPLLGRTDRDVIIQGVVDDLQRGITERPVYGTHDIEVVPPGFQFRLNPDYVVSLPTA